jgi:REP element-mobilizing transposase RayT
MSGFLGGYACSNNYRTLPDFTGQNFWARGYFVSMVGRDEEVIRRYIRKQEAEDNRLEQLEMFKDN